MAHELDQIAGHVSYADSRRDAWHQLGQQVGHAMTAREALRAAHLADWNVRKLALVVPQEPIITEAGVTTRHRCRCPTSGRLYAPTRSTGSSTSSASSRPSARRSRRRSSWAVTFGSIELNGGVPGRPGRSA